ncbi:MAG: PilZ domain-containing protein [Candidatus Omnitrophica bacterium]|nr:PilZ domain-containing protein [Candidatus Omnitrophota bacterium]MBU1871773.1 PilZ domain-containing protein [Candidatus Omnitrophota bacterium]
MAYSGSEKRKDQRAKGRFLVTYRLLEDAEKTDITQTKDISIGGMIFVTKRKLSAGAELALEIGLPFESKSITLIGSVLESKEVVADLVYDTRVIFLSVEKKNKQALEKTVNYFKQEEKGISEYY